MFQVELTTIAPYTITLPTPRLGLRYTFVTTNQGSNEVTVTAGTNLFRGVRIDVVDTSAVTGATDLNFAPAGELGNRMCFIGCTGFYSVATFAGKSNGIYT